MRRAALAAVALLVLAGCGGPGKTNDAAELVPPGATSYVRARTAQLPRATALLVRFPARGAVLRAVPQPPRGAGPELDVATVAGGQLFYTRPADEQAFGKHLDAIGRVHARIRGWTVFAKSPALLGEARHRRGSLAERPWYLAAAATLHSRGALEELVPGWRAAALFVRTSDAELDVHRLRPPVPQASSALAEAVPADAVAAAGIAGPASVPAAAPKLLRQLAAALGGPSVGWVRRDAGLPEVTVVAQPVDARQALRATAKLLAQLTKNPSSVAVTIDGVALTEVPNGAVDLYYGIVDGRLIVTDSAGAAGRLGRHGKTLPAVSKLPGATESWAYANVRAALPLAVLFAGLFDTTVPQTLQTSLEPLRDLFVVASHEGRVATVVTTLDLG
jgi:hypothetical protein